MKTTPYLKLERRIAASERGGILDRWRYGRQLLDDKAGRLQLPHGLIDSLIKRAVRAGLKLSEREIRYRIRCAEAYLTERQVGTAGADFGSWSALREAGFPAVEDDGTDPDELEAEGLDGPPDEWEQLQLDIPGLKPIISVRGRKVHLTRDDDGATVADVADYLDMCEEKHESFGKTVDHIRESLATMREGAGGDEHANAVESWDAATGGGPDEGADGEEDEAHEAWAATTGDDEALAEDGT